MEDILKYYYDLSNIEIQKRDDNFLIVDDKDYTYLLCKYHNEDINYIINILSNYKNNKYGLFIKNREGSYILKYDKNEYVLILLRGILNEEVNLQDIIINNNVFRYLNNYNIDLIELWSKKIDYLEYQISELAKENREVLNSFSFFIGLAENAITFISVNNINFNNIRKSLEHKRMNLISNVYYYNPLNILIDYNIRDLAEYVKSNILKDDILNNVNYILDNAQLNSDELKLFYARLMFPTYYFDLVEDIILNKENESILDLYVENVDKIINFLNDTYIEIKKRISIDIPVWIKKGN